MRVVLDTNQLVAALLRPPELATFVMAWEAARFTVDNDLMAPEVKDLLAEMGIFITSSAELLQILDSKSDV